MKADDKIIADIRAGANRLRIDMEAVPADDLVILWGEQPLYTDASGTIGSCLYNGFDRATMKVWSTPSRARALHVASTFRGQLPLNSERVYVEMRETALKATVERNERIEAAIAKIA